MSDADPEELRVLLCAMQDAIQRRVIDARDGQSAAELSAVAAVTPADTIYRVDRFAEAAILEWFETSWPSRWPVELVVEGLEGRGAVVFPSDGAPEDCVLRCLIDPIDGTRSFMYDKRSAWVLASLAPQRGVETRLSDIVVAAMTELPVAKQRLADQVSAVRGCGPDGIVAERVCLESGERRSVQLRPTAETDFEHGFVSIARFFPEAKTLLSRFEEALWQAVYPDCDAPGPMIFDDQYICSGGQLYELLAGRDRMFGDLRPLAFRALGIETRRLAFVIRMTCARQLDPARGGLSGAAIPHGALLDAPNGHDFPGLVDRLREPGARGAGAAPAARAARAALRGGRRSWTIAS